MARSEVKELSRPSPGEHVAACGLFCTNCRTFQAGRCQGCQVSPAFASCPTRRCCAGKGIVGCWQCDELAAPRDYRECKKVNNMIARVISLFTKSDRPGALALIRDRGMEPYLAARRESGKM